ADDAAVFLLDAWQEARNVLKGDDGDVEAVAEADEARALIRRVDVEHASQHGRLLRDDADRTAIHAGEADDDVARPLRMNLEKAATVDHRLDDQLHVIRLIGVVGNDLIQRFFGARDAVSGYLDRWIVHVIGGQVAHQHANLAQALDLCRYGEV